MKTLLIAVLLTVCGSATADDCYYVNERVSTVQDVPTSPRAKKPKYKPKPVVGSQLKLTPYTPVRPYPAPRPISIKTLVRYDCPPPITLPPGVPRVGYGYGIPYIGIPPVWGVPFVPDGPTGPAPVYPGSPDDFPPGLEVPPPPGGFTPPTDVPEPSILAMMLLGLYLIRRKA